MRPRDFSSNQQCEFIQKLLEKRLRENKREWFEMRLSEIEYDKETGTALAKLGNTKILCTVETEISAPRKASRSNAGSIYFLMELLPMAHPAAADSALDVETEECLTMLDSLYRDTFCIDFETLCIETNQYVFEMKCSLKVLDYDGGLFDCASLAVTTALMGFKRNDTTYDAVTKKLTIHSGSEKAMIPLTMIYKPATVTFGFIKGIIDPIIDPTENECLQIDGYLIIGANRRGEICLMYQYGKLKISSETILKCSQLAIAQAKVLIEMMAKTVYGKNDDITQ